MAKPLTMPPWRTRSPAATLLILSSALLGSTCDQASSTDTTLEQISGTWGGDDVGLIVGETVAHVHVGCTYGDFPAPIALDDALRFSISGEYLLRAYPVAVGPTMPAQLAGVLRGRNLTLTVAVNDTVEKQLVVLGPITVTFGREPRMGPCPICDKAEEPEVRR